MAGAAVSFVLGKLDDFAVEVYQVRDEVELMQRELRLIQCFLRDADSKRKKSELVKQWVKEVREVAYKIEDAMDNSLVEIEENRAQNAGRIGIFKKKLRMNPFKLAGLSGEIKTFRKTVTTLYERRTHLGITEIGAGSEDNSWVPFRPSKPHEIDVSEVVGLDSDKGKIIGQLLDRSISRRTVLSIVGIGGLGKTTLAQKVYKSTELEGQFDCRTWLSISQKFEPNKLLREILYSIKPQMKTKEPTVTDDELPIELQRSLREKRYLIILDDVWKTDLWERLKVTLPDMKNGSRVVITSRSLDVAKAADPEILPYQLPYLTEEESLTLLLRKAFPHKNPDNYPPYLMNVAKQLTKKCGRLPLALVVLGGILSRKEHTYIVWKTVEQTMDWHNEEGEKCSQVLAMSYEDLPYHLKPCFLYFASYPEDYKISAKQITKIWIAEGFISKDRVGTLEDNADIFLEELALRSLVQVIEKSWNGKIKSCRVHDLLLDLAIHEAKEQNFFTIFSKAKDGRQQNAGVARRATLQFCTPIEYGFHPTNTRSLLLFRKHILNSYGLRLLRVLSIENVDISRENRISHEEWLKDLFHLRYLGFRNCNLARGFGRVSFRTFKYLETLDFKKTEIHNESNEGPNDSLWEISTLRHVISDWKTPIICNLTKWDNLKNLQTLKWVRLRNVPKLECNINLRKLGIDLGDDFRKQCGSVDRAQHMLKDMLKRMDHLVFLSVASSKDGPFPLGDTSDIPCYNKIQSLYIWGNCRWPRGGGFNVGMFPENLIKLKLTYTILEEDPMPILEKLQSLWRLDLWIGSYVGRELKCSMGGFPSLQKLRLQTLWNLRSWDVEKRAMPVLNHLEITQCRMLVDVSPEIKEVFGITSEDLKKDKLIVSGRREEV